jgi:N-acetylglutamate synthase-like GNAT family acetyltransferase
MSTPSSSLRIRRAVREDAKELTRVINAAFGRAEMFFVEGDRVSLEEVLEYLDRGEFLIVEDTNAMRGCVYLEDRDHDRTYLGLLSVDPASQRGGIGSFLMEAAEQECRVRKSRHIDILIVNLRAELPTFYGNRGYTETGTSPFPTDIPTKLPCHFINMSKQLNPETA